jgi:hypothetical protein
MKESVAADIRSICWSQVEPYWDKQAAKKLGGKVDPVDGGSMRSQAAAQPRRVLC